MIVHIVMWELKEENKSENLSSLKAALEGLVSKVPTLGRLEVGINFSSRDVARDIVLYSEFESKEDLAAYAVHSEHVKVIELVKQIASETRVVDYEK
jgi:hypothetical protein